MKQLKLDFGEMGAHLCHHRGTRTDDMSYTKRIHEHLFTPEHRIALRDLFAGHTSTLPLSEAAELIGASHDWLERQLAERGTGGVPTHVEAADIVDALLLLWPVTVVGRMLGDHADECLPPLLRSTTINVTLPRYAAIAAEALARETAIRDDRPLIRVGDVVADIILDLVDTEAVEHRVPGFREAVQFPFEAVER